MAKKIENYDKSKKIATIKLKKYLIFCIPIAILELAILTVLWFLAADAGKVTSLFFVTLDFLVFTTFLVIFDGIPARTLKKKNYILNSKMTKSQGMVFYNALKYITVVRGVINLFITIMILIFSLLYIIY